MASTSFSAANGGRWFVSSNWSAGIPGSGDDAVIQLGAAVLTTVATQTMPADPPASAKSLTLNSGTGLELDDYSSLSVGGNVLNQGAIALDPGPYGWGGAVMSVAGTLTNQGRIAVQNGGQHPRKSALTQLWAAAGINDNAAGRIELNGSTNIHNRSVLAVSSA